jgi:small GTP-binding protein
MEKIKYEDKFNIMIIGDEMVGKTSIIERYFKQTFLNERKRTIGIEHYDKTIKYEDKNYLFKIWDTAGQEKFRTIGKTFYQKAHGMILTCAINNKQSFDNLKIWLKNLEDTTDLDRIQLIIIANKSDLETERKVKNEDIKRIADDLGVEYFEASAKMGLGVEEAMNNLCYKIFRNHTVRYSRVGMELEEGRHMSKLNSRCC